MYWCNLFLSLIRQQVLCPNKLLNETHLKDSKVIRKTSSPFRQVFINVVVISYSGSAGQDKALEVRFCPASNGHGVGRQVKFPCDGERK